MNNALLQSDLQRDDSVRVKTVGFEQLHTVRLKLDESALGQRYTTQLNLAVLFNVVHAHHLGESYMWRDQSPISCAYPIRQYDGVLGRDEFQHTAI
jgi:hypothetical protein